MVCESFPIHLGKLTQAYDSDCIILSTKFTPQIAADVANPMEEMLAGSFDRLGTDTVDIYWIHHPTDVERWTPFLIPLLHSGKVKSVGVSNHNLTEIKRAQEILFKEGFRLSAVQNHYSLLYHSSEKAGILDYCKEQGIAFWVYMVLEQAHFPASMTWRILFPKAVSVATHITRYSLK